MKKLLLFLCFVCAMKFVSAQTYLDLCYGTEIEWGITMNSTDTIVYFQSFTDTNSYFNNRIYDTIVGGSVMIFADTDKIYEVVSVNGVPTVNLQKMIITVLPVFTISIPPDLVHHVTCPDGYLYPYMDGSFHVSLDSPAQNYDEIDIFNDSTYFFYQTYDSVTLTDLRGGIYHVVAYGINGCEYHDSVIIEQPEPWVDLGTSADTLCHNETGCINLGLYGGTPPYNFTWFYYADTNQVFLLDTTRLVCGLSAGGTIYFVYMYDSKGCKFFGDETEFVICYLFEYAEDSISLSATNSRVCFGGVDTLHAQSIGYETGYMWHVGNLEDSVNYSTWIETDSVYIAEYLTPPMTESTWLSVDFSDQHGCVTHDSVWVEVYNPDVSMTIQTPEIITDSTCTVQVSPSGGNLYVDDNLIASNIPSNYTFSTAGISVGDHVLKYAGIFGGEVGLACEDEVTLPIQVEINPLVTDWKYEISIYPNPATTTLNLSSTGVYDFELLILDMTGKVIKAEKMLDQTFTFDVSDLASGIYLLRLESNDGATKSIKFVKR